MAPIKGYCSIPAGYSATAYKNDIDAIWRYMMQDDIQ